MVDAAAARSGVNEASAATVKVVEEVATEGRGERRPQTEAPPRTRHAKTGRAAVTAANALNEATGRSAVTEQFGANARPWPQQTPAPHWRMAASARRQGKPPTRTARTGGGAVGVGEAVVTATTRPQLRRASRPRRQPAQAARLRQRLLPMPRPTSPAVRPQKPQARRAKTVKAAGVGAVVGIVSAANVGRTGRPAQKADLKAP